MYLVPAIRFHHPPTLPLSIFKTVLMFSIGNFRICLCVFAHLLFAKVQYTEFLGVLYFREILVGWMVGWIVCNFHELYLLSSLLLYCFCWVQFFFILRLLSLLFLFIIIWLPIWHERWNRGCLCVFVSDLYSFFHSIDG